jgi:hypothetical protein
MFKQCSVGSKMLRMLRHGQLFFLGLRIFSLFWTLQAILKFFQLIIMNFGYQKNDT